MIRVTYPASEKIIDILIFEKSRYLRFGLQGGGCNGFQYSLSVSLEIEPDDIELKLDEFHSIIIDPVSNMYLNEVEIDYRKDLMGESFVFNNPLQTGSCGCSKSVSFD